MNNLIFDVLNSRYWVYGFDDHYPSGFLNDVQYCVADLEKAKELHKKLHYDVKGIFDTKYMIDITENYETDKSK